MAPFMSEFPPGERQTGEETTNGVSAVTFTPPFSANLEWCCEPAPVLWPQVPRSYGTAVFRKDLDVPCCCNIVGSKTRGGVSSCQLSWEGVSV